MKLDSVPHFLCLFSNRIEDDFRRRHEELFTVGEVPLTRSTLDVGIADAIGTCDTLPRAGCEVRKRAPLTIHLAQAIVVAIPFVFNLFFHERSALKKLILGVTGVIMLYAFLLTGSRGGFIGLAVVMFFLLRKKAGIFLGSAFALIALVGLLFVAPSSTVDRVRTISPYDDTGGARIQLWYEGWQMFLSNPIMGVGKDNFVEHEPTRHVAHNSFVHVAAELGFIGLFIWIGLLYFSFKALNNTRKLYVNVNNVLFSDPGHRTSDSELPELSRAHVLSDSLMVSMIGFASTAFFLSRQYEYLPYILIALSVALYQLANKDKGLKLAFSIEELRNVLLVTFMFLVVWSGILKAFA